MDLAKQIKKRTEEADDNLKHLKELEEPCGKLKEALPKDIPKMLPEILKCVRNVYQNSHYNTPDLITGLLRKISNEIIRRCRASIDIDELFEKTADVLKII